MAAPTALDLLWGTRDRPRRGPRPSLSLDRIVAEAISLADAEGLANLSMQHLAERLGCAKMALYRYVPGKSELVALMVDTALGDPPQLLGLGVRGLDAFVGDQVGSQVTEHRSPARRVTPKLSARLLVPHVRRPLRQN